jgi:hypothetical protein
MHKAMRHTNNGVKQRYEQAIKPVSLTPYRE